MNRPALVPLSLLYSFVHCLLFTAVLLVGPLLAKDALVHD